MLGQSFVVIVFARACRQFDEGLRASVALTAVVTQKSAPDGVVRRFLIELPNRRVDAKSLRINLFGILIIDRVRRT